MQGLAYHIAAECGFHGGLFLPMLSMGAMLGQVFVNETGVDPFVAQSCSLIALGAAVAPAPFFLAVLSMSCLAVGPAGLVPIFATATAAHLFCMGLGAPQALVAAALRRARKSVSRK